MSGRDDAVPAHVPARIVNEVLYCERLAFLEWVQREFADSADTVEGRVVHARADAGGRPLAAPADPDDPPEPPPPYTARSVWLSSDALGLTAKIDVVEAEGGAVVPVEYKRGPVPDLPERAWPPERAQVCAQVLLLREHGYRCDHGELYFAADRTRVRVEIDDALVALTLGARARAHALAVAGVLPPPLVDSPKCPRCSLAPICLPDEVNLLRALAGDDAFPTPDAAETADAPLPPPAPDAEPDPWGLALPADPPAPPAREVRRLIPAREPGTPLYVQAQGGRVGLEGDRLRVEARGEPAVLVRVAHTSHVALYGNVQLTTQALAVLLERDIPVFFFSYGGWLRGRTVGHAHGNVELRIAQHRAQQDTDAALRLARAFVAAKIRNQRTLLRRNHDAPDETVLGELEVLARRASGAADTASLLGFEGAAARLYFSVFSGMMRGLRGVAFDLEGRNRRPPRDPVNAMLSFAYSLLAKDCTVAATAVGLDPMLGYLHQPRFGRPALALDLMEEMRPLVADSTVITAVNNEVIGASHFVQGGTACNLTDAGRRRFIEAYERRMDQLVTHPIFGYRLSYRRLLEVQARLLARTLLGELDEYVPFRTR